jgi:4-amino-4-deoxychorismate lyase
MSLPASWVNHQPGATSACLDRGYRYGDSLFETLRYHQRQYHLLDYHLQRMRAGSEVLDIAFPEDRLREQLLQGADYLAAHSIEQACARLVLSRGGDGGGYRPTAGPANISLSLTPIALKWRGVPAPASVIRCDIALATQPRLAGIKHSNRLEQVLAAREVAERGADEGLLLNANGELVSAVSANVFAVFDGTLLSPPLRDCGVAGTVRRLIIDELAPAAGIAFAEEPLPWADLQQASEMFLCNALIGIRAVAAYPGRSFTSTALGDNLRQQFFAWSEQPTA